MQDPDRLYEFSGIFSEIVFDHRENEAVRQTMPCPCPRKGLTIVQDLEIWMARKMRRADLVRRDVQEPDKVFGRQLGVGQNGLCLSVIKRH